MWKEHHTIPETEACFTGAVFVLSMVCPGMPWVLGEHC